MIAAREDAPLQTALERLAEADILLVQGLPPSSDYRFKHALIQDAAYENLLKSRRQALHRRVGEALLNEFAATAGTEPELLAHHFTQAGLIEAAIEWWGKAGHRSLERSALVEAIEHLTRALDQIATLLATPSLRREEIKLQVALLNTLMPVKGYAAPETKAAAERTRLLIEQAEALGEPPEDPLLPFSVLYGFVVASWAAFDGDLMRELAGQFLALAERQHTTAPLLLGHRLVGAALLNTGDIAKSRAHLDQGIALYDPAEHRPLATRFGQDARVTIFFFRPQAVWMLGYPEAALADTRHALEDAREIGQVATSMVALWTSWFINMHCRNNVAANAYADELLVLADEKGASYWKAAGVLMQGCSLAMSGKASEAVKLITSALAANRSTGMTVNTPWYLVCLTIAYAELCKFDEAWRCIGEAMSMIETSKEAAWEAEVNRMAGEISLVSPEPDATKAESYFERALAVARQQQAKSWELRAAMGMSRLWRDQGKRGEARDLLAPVYGWFTEGFDTLDLKDAKVLLDELAA
jgi:predicted ATPase